MAKRRRLLSGFSLSILLCSAEAWVSVARGSSVAASSSSRGWPQARSDDVVRSPSSQDAEDNGPYLPRRTSVAPLMEARSPSAASCAVTPAPIFDIYRRQVSDQAVTIVFLSSALASANGNSISMSRSMASSISQLQLSLSSLSSAASGAILSLQASASSVLQAAEASASDAIAAVEESASSRVSEVLASVSLADATATAASPDVTKYQAQTLMATREPSVSIAVVAGAVAASVVGTTLASILAFYLFVFRRRAKRREREEQERKKEEVDVNAALDRAIVSYIAKESPSPTTPNIGTALGTKEVAESKPRPVYLAPPPAHPQHGLRPSDSLPSAPPPQSPPRATDLPTPTSPPGTSPLSTQRSVPYPMAGSPPPGPPPMGPLPLLPPTTNLARKFSRRKPSQSSPSSSEVYSDILDRPLHPMESIRSPASEGRPRSSERPWQPERRGSNWPLTETKWV